MLLINTQVGIIGALALFFSSVAAEFPAKVPDKDSVYGIHWPTLTQCYKSNELLHKWNREDLWGIIKDGLCYLDEDTNTYCSTDMFPGTHPHKFTLSFSYTPNNVYLYDGISTQDEPGFPPKWEYKCYEDYDS